MPHFRRGGRVFSELLKIIGIIADQVSAPSSDGTPGGALYPIPFRLSHVPSQFWAEALVQAWNTPPQFTSMHRPGIANVIGNTIVLDGTTLEEVEKYHRDTLGNSGQAPPLTPGWSHSHP